MLRVSLFLDGGYLLKGMEEVMGQGWRLDYSRFIQVLVADRMLQRVYFYNAWLRQMDEPKGYAQQQRFIAYLQSLDYFTLRNGRLAGTWPDVRQKGVDVRLALDMVKLAYKGAYDVAVLLSGDSDIVEAVQSVQENGQHVELWYFDVGRTRTSDELRTAADLRRQITSDVLEPLAF